MRKKSVKNVKNPNKKSNGSSTSSSSSVINEDGINVESNDNSRKNNNSDEGILKLLQLNHYLTHQQNEHLNKEYWMDMVNTLFVQENAQLYLSLLDFDNNQTLRHFDLESHLIYRFFLVHAKSSVTSMTFTPTSATFFPVKINSQSINRYVLEDTHTLWTRFYNIDECQIISSGLLRIIFDTNFKIESFEFVESDRKEFICRPSSSSSSSSSLLSPNRRTSGLSLPFNEYGLTCSVLHLIETNAVLDSMDDLIKCSITQNLSVKDSLHIYTNAFREFQKKSSSSSSSKQ